MEQNEKYGIELEAIVSSFKDKLKSTAQMVKNFGKQAEKDAKINIDIGTGYEKRIAYVKSQLEDIKALIDGNKNQANKGQEPSTNLLELEAEYEELTNKLENLDNKQEAFNNDLEETEEKSHSINLGELFDKSISKIKRFTYYLLGARSVFSMFMKYQSIYFQYNEQMQYQSELSQNAIALSLAPAFEFLGNVVAYASIAIAKFVELLTGVNVLSKVSTKGIRDYNKSLKETQTLISGIDEITNLNMPNSTGLASQYKALDDFKKKVKKVEDFFNKNTWISDLATGISKVWDYVEKIYTYVSDHWDVFKYLLGAVALSAITIKVGLGLVGATEAIGSIGTLFGLSGTAGTGLIGFATALKYLAGLGAISLFIALSISGIEGDIDQIKEKGFKKFFVDTLNEVFDEYLPKTFQSAYDLGVKWWLEPFTTKIKEDLKPIWQPIIDELTPSLQLVKDEWDNFFKPKIIDPMTSTLQETKDNIVAKFTPFLNSLIDSYNRTLGLVFGKIDYLGQETKKATGNSIQDIRNKLKEFGIDLDKLTIVTKDDIDEINLRILNLTDEQKEELRKLGLKIGDLGIDAEQAVGGIEDKAENTTNTINGNIDDIQENIEDVGKMKVDFSIGATITSAYNAIKGFFSSFGIKMLGGKLSTSIGLNIKPTVSNVPNVSGTKTNSNGYAKGLDYVPYDEYPAILHKGEAVVPAKYNPTIHSAGNEYTNSLLETLVIKMDDLAKRPNVFEVDGQQFANATYGLYEEARNRQNYVRGVEVK